MGNRQSNLSPNTEDWNNIKTTDMSSADLKLLNIRSDAQTLVSILPNTESETFADSPTNNLYNRIYMSIKENNSEAARTETSPFISEEMYNYLVESSSENNKISESFNLSEVMSQKMVGGGKVETSTTISNLTNMKSDSSNIDIENATSSSRFNDFELEHSSLEYEGNTSSERNVASSNKSASASSVSLKSSSLKSETVKTVSEKTVSSEFNNMFGGAVQNLKYNSDYESSSAHTSSHSSDRESVVNNESSFNETTISVGNQKILSDSINTSDINIITVDE